VARLHRNGCHFCGSQELTTALSSVAWRVHSLSAKPKTDMNTKSESTYTLLVRSQEKGRTVLEILVFVLCIFSVVLVIWQFAQTPLETSAPGGAPCIACQTSAPKLPARG
jgi:hypothetical protein